MPRYGDFFRYIVSACSSWRAARASEEDVPALITSFRSFHAGRAANVRPHIFFAAAAEDKELLDYFADDEMPEQL